MTDPNANSSSPRPFPYLWILLGAWPAVLPLIKNWEDFSSYYYMGDEWAQLLQIDDWGYWPWVFGFFGENFMPAFKLVWSAILFLGNGSYFFFVLVQFLMHVLVVFLLGCLLRQWKLSWFVVLFAQWVLALSHTHIEILMQSIQLSNLLSYSCLLILAIYTSDHVLKGKGFSPRSCCLIASLSLLGALTFSRGLLNGSALFATFALIGLVRKEKPRLWMAPALSALLPCLAVGLLTAYAVFGNTGSSSNGIQWIDVSRHTFYQLSLNPFFQHLRNVQISQGLAVQLLSLNAVLLALAWFSSRRHQRPLLVFFIFFFLGNGLLLSLGRSHMEIDTTASWRYQYGVLLCFAPMVALILDRLIAFIPKKWIQVTAQIILIGWVSGWVYDPWNYHSTVWSDLRGTRIRTAVGAEPKDPEAFTISGFDGVRDGRAVELIEKYNLH